MFLIAIQKNTVVSFYSKILDMKPLNLDLQTTQSYADSHRRTATAKRDRHRKTPMTNSAAKNPSPQLPCLYRFCRLSNTTDFMSNSSFSGNSHYASAQAIPLSERDIKSRCGRRRHSCRAAGGEFSQKRKLSLFIYFEEVQEYASYVRSRLHSFRKEESQ